MVDYDKVSNYDGKYITEDCLKENQAIFDALNEYIRPTDRVLDLGCGTGFALDICDKINKEKYIGADISPNMIARAREKHAANFMLSSAEKITVRNFDIVLSLFSIPYIGMESIPTIYNSLKKGGIVTSHIGIPRVFTAVIG